MFALVALALGAAGAAQAAGPVVWAIPSLQRVRPDDAAGSASSISLAAAKGEAESFQIVVKAPSANGLTNVNVTAPSLGGAQVTLYREYYIYLPSGSGDWATNRNKPEKPGWFPDGLVPFTNPSTGTPLTGGSIVGAPFAVSAGKNQPVWVDITVPRGATAGTYTGTFTVTSDQGSASVTVSFQVWNFTLPLKPAEESCVLYWSMRNVLQPEQELLRNRLMTYSAALGDERGLIDNYGQSAINAGFWANANPSAGTINAAPSISQFQASKAAHQPDLHVYNYTADEIGFATSLYPTLKQWAYNMHQAGIDNLITMPPTPELYDDGTGRSVVDIWTILPKQYDAYPDRVSFVLQKGDQVWSYNCNQQDDYSPKWQIDYAPINYRIQPGFINQSLGLTGLLYWRADYWSTTDPWNAVPWAPYPGEGLLVYPGDQVGLKGQVVPSMRLKFLRDGIDDYDYVDLLKKAGQGDWALSVARTIGPDWSNWTRDPNALETARRQLGDKLDSLGGGGGGGTTTFSDVPLSFWAAPQIYACVGAGIVQGLPDNTYRPKDAVTRAQMAVYVARALAGGDSHVPAGPAQATFTDVATNYWAYKYVEYAAAQGVVQGVGGGKYDPEAWVDRGQMAVFIARSIASPVGEAGLSGYAPPSTPTFTDVDNSFWAYNYVEYLAARGVVQGLGDGTYRPAQPVQRDQMAVYVQRAFKLATQ